MFLTKNSIFVFDIDGVILKPDFKKVLKIILFAPKLTLLSIFLYPRLLYKTLRNQDNKTSEEILNEIIKAEPKLETFVKIAYKIAYAKKEIPGTCGIIKDLKAKGYKLIILSNEGVNSMQFIAKRHSIFSYFDDMFLTTSTDNYLKKPDPKYFEKFLKWVENKGFEAENLIFIDDKAENVNIANSMGIPSILFKNAKDLALRLV